MTDHKLCVYKVSPSGIQKPLYYGSEEDCKRFCENQDYEFIDEEQIVWYLEIGSSRDENEGDFPVSKNCCVKSLVI